MRWPVAMLMVIPAVFAGPITINYGDLPPLSGNGWIQFSDVWDLTQCDLTISYRIDLTGVNPKEPNEYENPANWTSWTNVGVTGGAVGWMSSGAPRAYITDPNSSDMDDKHNLGAPGRYDELSYDAIKVGDNYFVNGDIGSYDNYGIWFDRDGVDPWQADYWGAVDGGTYNTGGIYEITLILHAINPTLGAMFATINGVEQGFYIGGWENREPDWYPAGKSIEGDLTNLQIFASITTPVDPTWDFGQVIIQDLTVTGCLVPEPGSLALLALGAGLLPVFMRRK